MKKILFLSTIFLTIHSLGAQVSLTVMPYLSQGESQNLILQVLSVKDQGQGTPKDVVVKLMDKEGNPISELPFSFFINNDRANQMERVYPRPTENVGEFNLRWTPAVEKGIYKLWVEVREMRPYPPKLTLPSPDKAKKEEKTGNSKKANQKNKKGKKGKKDKETLKNKVKPNPRASEFVGTTLAVFSI